MAFLFEYGLFLAKVATIVLAIVVIITLVAVTAMRGRSPKGQLVITDLGESFHETQSLMQEHLLDKKSYKKWHKQTLRKATDEPLPRLFVLEFIGSMDAKETDALREEVSAILAVAKPEDEVLLKLESGGGVVHGYGLAASQLNRFRLHNIPLTIAVDKVAASGGYMMACVANKLLAAPFAIIGSIGVIAQLPNFHKLLKKNDVDFEQFTAGEFKRTVTLFGENTDKGRQKFQQELEETHSLFKDFVSQQRPQLDVTKVATGEHWFGYQALALNLIDELSTSDDYLQAALKHRQVLSVRYQLRKGLADKLGQGTANIAAKLWQRLQDKRWF